MSWVNFIELFPPRHMRLNIHASIRASQLNVLNSVNTIFPGDNGYNWNGIIDVSLKGRLDLARPIINF